MKQPQLKERSFIPVEYLQLCIKIADKEGHKIIFPHTYINCFGERCDHLSPLNTSINIPQEKDLKVCKKCGKQERLSMFNAIYCNCKRYPNPNEKEMKQ